MARRSTTAPKASTPLDPQLLRRVVVEGVHPEVDGGRFPVEEVGEYEYTVEGWIDRFETWRHELSKKFGAGQDVSSELHEGAALVRAAGVPELGPTAAALADDSVAMERRVPQALAEELQQRIAQHPDRSRA